MQRQVWWVMVLGVVFPAGCGPATEDAGSGGETGTETGAPAGDLVLEVGDLSQLCGMSGAGNREDLFRRKSRLRLEPGTYGLEPPETVPFSLTVLGEPRPVMPGEATAEILMGELVAGEAGDLGLQESPDHRTLDYRLAFTADPPLDPAWDGTPIPLGVRQTMLASELEETGTFPLDGIQVGTVGAGQTMVPCDVPPANGGTVTTTITTAEGTVVFRYSATPFRATGSIMGYAFDVDTYEDLEAQAPGVAVVPGWAVRFPTPGPQNSCGLWVREDGSLDGPVGSLIDCDNQDIATLDVVSVEYE